MIDVAVFCRTHSEVYLRQITQLGADCVDLSQIEMFLSDGQETIPSLETALEIRRRIERWGLYVNRVTLPRITDRYVSGLSGGDKELEDAKECLRIFARAGFPIARLRVSGSTRDERGAPYRATHRGGYTAHAVAGTHDGASGSADLRSVDEWWKKFLEIFGELVPIAEETGIKLAIHPSDAPHPGTPFGNLGFHRILDAFPSRKVGFVYCVGTRAEEAGQPLVLQEINTYGRKGRIFECHFRNIRGNLAGTRAYEETLLDDGDMNMFRLLQELDKVGFSGALNPDHIPSIEGDDPETTIIGLAYSVGYIKAAITALMETRRQ